MPVIMKGIATVLDMNSNRSNRRRRGRRRVTFLSVFISSVERIAALIAILMALIGLCRWIYYRSPHVKAGFELHSLYGCSVEGIKERCSLLFDGIEPGLMPRIDITIVNNSNRQIVFDESDGCEIDLEKYIPYEDLSIYNEAGGANGWSAPKIWDADIGTETGIYRAVPEEIDADGETGSFFEIDEKGTDKFIVRVNPTVPGYYRFRVKLNYRMNNKKHSIQSDEHYEYVKEPPLEFY